jgi:hypothetical protein
MSARAYALYGESSESSRLLGGDGSDQHSIVPETHSSPRRSVTDKQTAGLRSA